MITNPHALPNPESRLEYPGCNICGATASALLFAEGAGTAGERARGIVCCLGCGLIYRNIRKSEAAMRQYYRNKTDGRPSPEWMRGRKRVFLPYMERLSEYRRTNRILDVGAGHGFFLAACRKDGWEGHGLEYSHACRQHAESELGILLDGADITTFNGKEAAFDVVTFWNVLDHLHDPKRALQSAYQLLRPGGAVFIRCPNADFHVRAKKLHNGIKKLAPRFFKVNPLVFHLYAFNRRTLGRLLGTTGFEKLSIRPAQLGWTTSPSGKSSLIRRAIASWAGLLAKGVYGFTAGGLLISPSIMAIGVKRSERCLHWGNR